MRRTREVSLGERIKRSAAAGNGVFVPFHETKALAAAPLALETIAQRLELDSDEMQGAALRALEGLK